MDGNTQMPGSRLNGIASSLAFYLPPLVVVLAGLAITAFSATIVGRYAHEQSEALFQARHAALVNALADYREVEPDTQVFESRFNSQIPSGISVRIDTLQTHSKTPAFESRTGQKPQANSTLRSEVVLAGKTWLVTSIPDRAWFRERADRLVMPVWVCGLAISLLGTLVSGLLAIRWRRQTHKTSTLQQEQQVQNRELLNAQTEKRILRQALEDSEQRSRDLVMLSGGIVCELDETGQAGFVSARMADMLGYAPADLAGVKLDTLIATPDHTGFRETLEAARKDRQLQRLDLTLIAVNQASLPATLRVLALHDTLHGFSGYRLTLQARQ